MCPVVSFGGELLGEIRLKFQLLMATNLVDMKGGMAREVKVAARNAASSGPEEGGSSPPPELVVETDVSLTRAQRATRSKLPSHVTTCQEEEELGTPPTVRWNILKSGRSLSSPATPTYSVVGGLRGKTEEVPSLGPKQQAVVEELIARGTRLHSKMVQSLLRDSPADQQRQERAEPNR